MADIHILVVERDHPGDIVQGEFGEQLLSGRTLEFDSLEAIKPAEDAIPEVHACFGDNLHCYWVPLTVLNDLEKIGDLLPE